jgi:hypothetical protein
MGDDPLGKHQVRHVRVAALKVGLVVRRMTTPSRRERKRCIRWPGCQPFTAFALRAEDRVLFTNLSTSPIV